MGWFPCSGRSSEKPKKKKSGQDDPPTTTSSFTSSTSTSTCSSSDKTKINPRSNMKKEAIPRPDVRKEVHHRSNVKKDASPRPNVRKEAHHHHRSNVRKEGHRRTNSKDEVNARSNVNRDEHPLLNLNKGLGSLLNLKENSNTDVSENCSARIFTFSQLEAAAKNFREDCFLGEGGFGRVYKGKIEGINQVLAIKKLDRHSAQGNKEFLVEVLMLSLLHHPNLVNLVGYCADGHQRLLVYEYLPLGSLEDHLHDILPKKKPLDWNARMKIAAGAAKGLEYLHDKANPPVIYRDLKSANILLDEGYHAKLSDFGLAKLGPTGDNSHVSTRVMGTYGYCAPEYAMTGQLTLKSDIYSFGVVLLEIITGRKAMDYTKPTAEQNLVHWAKPLFKDRKNFPQMVDPKLRGLFPLRGMYQALAVAAMCVQEQAALRPAIGDVVTALSYLASQTYLPEMQSAQNSPVASAKVWPRMDSTAMRNHTL